MNPRTVNESPQAERTKRDSKLKSAILAVTAVSKFKHRKERVRPTSLDLSGCMISSTNLTSDGSPRFIKSPGGDELNPDVSRNFIRDGPVCLSAGVTSLNRYMFLFNDLLLVAKPKSGGTFKLKLRLPVSELWLQNSVDGVSESSVSTYKSFVIGWPTISYVAIFSTPEDKTLWWNVLKKTINEQRTIDCGRTLPIQIVYRDPSQKNIAPLSLPISNEDDVKSVVKMALEAFDMGGSDADDFQLWVVSGKENSAYPLMGHEIPFCIKTNHIRQANVNLDSPITDRHEFLEERASPRSKCEFILKKKKTITNRLEVDSPNSQKRWKSPMKSPIINWALHKKPQKQNSFEQLSPQGSFFGLPLAQFSPDDEQLPTQVEDMLLELFRRGPSTDGIFRKSALMKTVKQLRQDLEEGKTVNFEDKSAVVIATIFKEFLRGLPSCAFGSEFLCEMLDTNDVADDAERIAEIEMIFNKLPKQNQILVKKFMCVLYHIARLSDINKMTSQNLAICIAPSLIWSSKSIMPSCAKETTDACEFVQFMIDNYIGIFGEEATKLLGDESEIQPPVTYDDEEMPENGQETTDINTLRKSPEESCGRNPDFTLSLRVPDHRVDPGLRLRSPEMEGKSSMTPRTPNHRRRFYDLKITSRRHSENDLTDLNDNLPVRKLRAKVPLTSYTTSAELIKHNVNGVEDTNEPSSTVIRIVSSTKETSPVANGRRKNSPSNHAIYHRKVRPTPTYEEAIRRLRRNAQLSSLFSRNSEERLESSDESIDQRYEEKSSETPQEWSSRKVSLISEDPVSLSEDASPKSVKSERQKLTYNILSPTADRLKSSRFAADELYRSPESVSGNSRHPSAPSYEQHLERRKRFEAAYLQKINLDLDSVTARKELSPSAEYNSEPIDYTSSFNGTECEKPSVTGSKGLAKSLDSAGLRALGLRSGIGGKDSVPLSNGIHTFITQRRHTNSYSNNDCKPGKHENIPSHAALKCTVSANSRLIQAERDNKPPSPLRAAIDVGSFMYRPSDASQRDYASRVNSQQENGHAEGSSHVNGICSPEKNNNFNLDLNSDVSCNQSLKLSGRNVEDFDKLLSSLKSRTESDNTNSSTESVGTLDVPSHEDIKTILCQDESYV